MYKFCSDCKSVLDVMKIEFLLDGNIACLTIASSSYWVLCMRKGDFEIHKCFVDIKLWFCSENCVTLWTKLGCECFLYCKQGFEKWKVSRLPPQVFANKSKVRYVFFFIFIKNESWHILTSFKTTNLVPWNFVWNFDNDNHVLNTLNKMLSFVYFR